MLQQEPLPSPLHPSSLGDAFKPAQLPLAPHQCSSRGKPIPHVRFGLVLSASFSSEEESSSSSSSSAEGSASAREEMLGGAPVHGPFPSGAGASWGGDAGRCRAQQGSHCARHQHPQPHNPSAPEVNSELHSVPKHSSSPHATTPWGQSKPWRAPPAPSTPTQTSAPCRITLNNLQCFSLRRSRWGGHQHLFQAPQIRPNSPRRSIWPVHATDARMQPAPCSAARPRGCPFPCAPGAATNLRR